jgi:hypothetical protein
MIAFNRSRRLDLGQQIPMSLSGDNARRRDAKTTERTT